MDNKQLYKITLTREQLMLISQCVEDISRFAAGDMDLQHTTDTLINDMDGAETLGIRSFIINNSRAIRRRLFPDLGDYEHIGYDGGGKDKINNKRNANRKPNIGMIKEYMDFIEYMNNDEDEEEKIVYDTILMIGDASGKEGQFSDSDKKTAENFGCEYMDVDDFVKKYKS